jgi:nucleoside-diphosphate-sugar epimerase
MALLYFSSRSRDCFMSTKARVFWKSSNFEIVRRLDVLISFSNEKDMIEVVEGDATKPNAGLDDIDVDRICSHRHITHVIHCAASVSFTQSLPDAAKANISSALYLQSFAARLNINVIVGSALVGADPTPCSALIEARHGGELVNYSFFKLAPILCRF